MADTKPPRSTGEERGTLLALLQYQRESLVRNVDGVDDDAARRSPVPSGTSLLWLVRHMARAESVWIHQRFAGGEPEVGDDTVGPSDSVASAVTDYRRIWEHTDTLVVAAPSLDVLCRDTGDGDPVSLRWVLLHLLEETARHAGHADILRELIDGTTGR